MPLGSVNERRFKRRCFAPIRNFFVFDDLFFIKRSGVVQCVAGGDPFLNLAKDSSNAFIAASLAELTTRRDRAKENEGRFPHHPQTFHPRPLTAAIF